MDVTCLLAAVFFIVGSSVSLAYKVKEHNFSNFDYSLFTMLDPDYIQADWTFRRENQPMEIAGGFINAFSWLLLAMPMIQTSVILSRGGTRKLSLHMFIGVLMIGGCAMEFLARFMHLGQAQWGNWLSSEYNMENWASATSHDDIGWRTLEVAHLVTYGTVVWIDSFEYLCLGLALVLFYISVNSLPPDGPVITRALAGFGLFIGLFSVADFVASVFRLEDWRTFTVLAMLISTINRLVLLPLFLLVLGRQLPRAVAVHKEQIVTTANGGVSVNRNRHWVDSTSSRRLDNVEMTAIGE